MTMRDVEAVYKGELHKRGKPGFVYHPESGSTVTSLHAPPTKPGSVAVISS